MLAIPTKGFRRFEEIVRNVADHLGEDLGRFELWNEPNAKEKGLDLLCYRPFPDNRVGIPVYFLQCASGGNWQLKSKTPDLDIWRDMIHFTTMPKRAFSTPFAFLDDDFTKNCVRVQGILLDRTRLLGASRYNPDWLSPDLQNRLVAWVEARVGVLLEKSK